MRPRSQRVIDAVLDEALAVATHHGIEALRRSWLLAHKHRKLAERIPKCGGYDAIREQVQALLPPPAPEQSQPTPLSQNADALAEIRRLRQSGMSLVAIAKRFEVSPNYLHILCKRLGIAAPERRTPLTQDLEAQAEIRRRRDAGETLVAIAEHLGVSAACLSQLCTRLGIGKPRKVRAPQRPTPRPCPPAEAPAPPAPKPETPSRAAQSRLAALRNLVSQLGHEDCQYAGWWAEIEAIEAGKPFDPLPHAVRYAVHDRSPAASDVEVAMICQAIRIAPVAIGNAAFRSVCTAALALFRVAAADLPPQRIAAAQERLTTALSEAPSSSSRQGASRRRQAIAAAGLPPGPLPQGLAYSHGTICTDEESRLLGDYMSALGPAKPSTGSAAMQSLANQFLESYRAEHGWPELLPRPSEKEEAA